MLCHEHNQLWINGHPRLLDVWRLLKVSSDTKPSHKKNKFINSNLHHINQSLTKYAVITTPIAIAIEDKYSFQNNRLIRIIIRTLIMFSTVIVALVAPFFGYIMAFSAFLSVTVSILLPCLFYLKINKVARSFGLELVMIGGIVVTGFFVGVIGTYMSLKQIVTHL